MLQADQGEKKKRKSMKKDGVNSVRNLRMGRRRLTTRRTVFSGTRTRRKRKVSKWKLKRNQNLLYPQMMKTRTQTKWR